MPADRIPTAELRDLLARVPGPWEPALDGNDWTGKLYLPDQSSTCAYNWLATDPELRLVVRVHSLAEEVLELRDRVAELEKSRD